MHIATTLEPQILLKFNQIIQLIFCNYRILQVFLTYQSSWVDEYLHSLNELNAYRIVIKNTLENVDDCGGELEGYLFFNLGIELNLTDLQAINLPFHSNILIIHTNKSLFENAAQIIDEFFNCCTYNISLLYFDISNKSMYELKTNWKKIWTPNANHRFRISIFEYEPMIYYNREAGFHGGWEKYILDEIIAGWNVTFIEHEPQSWFDVVEDVAMKRSDIALGGCWAFTINYTQIDMSDYYLQVCSTFIVPKPQLRHPSATYILQSLRISTYISVMAALLVVATTIKYIHPTESSAVCFILAYRSLLGNASVWLPKNIHGRIILASWLATIIIINGCFSAGLTHIISFPAFTPSVNTFNDMHAMDAKWIMRSESIIPSIRSSEDFALRNLEKLVIDVPRDQDPYFAKYGGPVNIIDNFVDVNFTDMHIIARLAKLLPICMAMNYFVYPLTRPSRYKLIFNLKLRMFNEAGLIQKWGNMIYYGNYKNLKLTPMLYNQYPEYEHFNVLQIQHLQGAFYILAVGCGIAICSLLLEISVAMKTFYDCIISLHT